MSDEYDDLLPVSLHRGSEDDFGGKQNYWLLDRHNDEIARFDPSVEIEDMERIVALINRKEKQ